MKTSDLFVSISLCGRRTKKRTAELGADSFGKLWAEVDKDIRVVAYTHTDRSLMEDGSFYDSKISSVSEYFN